MTEIAQWFAESVWPIWRGGGWLLVVLVGLALVIYYALIEQWREASRWSLDRLLALDEKTGLSPDLPPELQRAVSTPGPAANCARAFNHLRESILRRMDRRMAFLAILVGAAPLLGLLGTVSGLLTTFRGLAVEQGPLAQGVSGGIYEALITTQTGLIIAIPAYMMIYALRRRREQWAAAITHVESVTLRCRRKEAA